MKKILRISFICFVIFSIFSCAFATDLNTKLNIIQQSSEIKYLENEQGYISQKIVEANADTGELTVQIEIANTKKDTQENNQYENTEIYLIVSENIVTDDEKFSRYIRNIENLASKILKTNSKTKIGIIGITGTISDTTHDENGNIIVGNRDETNVEGRITDREIVVKATDSIDSLINGLKNMNLTKTKYYDNLQAVVSLGQECYSDNVNKILISLYDGVPSVAIGVKSGVSYGGFTGKTLKEAVEEKHENISIQTANEIKKLKNVGVSFILLRPDNTSYDETWYNSDTGEKILEFDGSPYVEKLYGTIENPTYGKMYSFNESNIDTIITENIYQDVKDIIQPDISNIKIVNYLTDDVINNFEISHEENASIDMNKETKTITWNIEILKGNEVSKLKYKLKINNMKDKALLNKEIAISEKTELSYVDNLEEQLSVTSTSSPKIKLEELIIDNTNNNINNNIDNRVDNNVNSNIEDPTVAKDILPKAGIRIDISIMFILFISGIYALVKYRKLKDI